MKNKKFDQAKYMREWQKENMKQVKASYKTEFVDEFKEACKKLGIKQSDVIRKAMQDKNLLKSMSRSFCLVNKIKL